MRIIFLILLSILFSFSLSGQDTLKTKPSIFVYSDDDSPFTLDVGAGTGFDNSGLKIGLNANLDVYHVLAGFVYSSTFGLIEVNETIIERSFIAGYRYRNNYIMLALASGYGWQKFKCAGDGSYDCYTYVEESINAVPINLQADFIVNDFFGVGIQVNHLVSSRKSMTGVMFGLKFGALRNVY